MASVQRRSRLQLWRDVIFAIFLREIRSQFNNKFDLGWGIFQPVAFICILTMIRGNLEGNLTHSMPTFVFMVYGMICVQLFLTVMSAASNSIQKNKPLFAFRQVQPIASTLAMAGVAFLIKVVVILVLALIIYFLQIEVQLADPLTAIWNLLMIGLLALDIGLLFALAKAFIPEITKVQSLLQRPLLFISGVFFSLQDLPRSTWPYFDWNPILHIIELNRQAAYPSYGAQGVSQFYVEIVALVLTFLASACYRLYWKKAISR